MKDAPDWNRVKSAIGLALELEPEERAAFVKRICSDDVALRLEVESVLGAIERAGSFAERPAIRHLAFSERRETTTRNSGPRALQRGDVLGSHEILDFLGAGGMGEVYRARDSRLHRDVALKVLPEAFAGDRDRLARFRREAQLLASLNHPNIAAIYGLEDSDDAQALVLELVEGPTLADRIATGPVPCREAASIARQIADGLTAAHRAGVVHRDLKPANIKRRPDGTVKILDFGLAKALHAIEADVAASGSASITDWGMSCEGAPLGTAAYMSPEQALGRAVDERADIWAFGCVVYEMVTGRRAFHGPSTRDTLAAVLLQEPDWRALPADAPPALVGTLRRCLEKNLDRRLSDLPDLGDDTEAPSAARRVGVFLRHHAAIPAAIVSTVLVGAAAMVWTRQSSPPPAAAPTTTTRLMIGLPASAPLALAASMPLGLGQQSIAIAPDGAQVVYVLERGGVRQLYRRSLDQFDAVPILNTEGAFGPFFSPDGRWLAFFANNKLAKVPVSGGNPIPLCEAPNPYGGTWGSDGTILFSSDEGRRPTRVHEAGGACERIAVANDRGSWRLPDMLPGRRAAIVSNPLLGVGVVSLDTGDFTVLVQGASGGRYAPSGHLVFGRSGAMLAAPFDLERLALTGPEVVILDGVHTDAVTPTPLAVFSRTGTLVYTPARTEDGLNRPVWVDRSGRVEPLRVPPRQYRSFSLSPDGRRLAIAIADVSTDIWVYDLERNTPTRLTSGGFNVSPIWTTDGTRVVFSERSDGGATPFWAPADGSRAPERLFDRAHRGGVGSFSPTGDLVTFQNRGRDTGLDLWVRPLRGPSPPQLFLRTRFTEVGSKFSADGRFISYVSDESGQYEVYVRPYPGPGGKWQVSTDGGEESIWSRDGRELFYRNGNKWMAAAVTLTPEFRAATPRLLFEGRYINVGGLSYDVAPDGRRFLLLEPTESQQAPVTHLNVVLNWFEEIKRHAGGSPGEAR